MKERKVYAYDFDGAYVMMQIWLIGFVKTTIDFALKSDLKDEHVPFLKKISELGIKVKSDVILHRF